MRHGRPRRNFLRFCRISNELNSSTQILLGRLTDFSELLAFTRSNRAGGIRTRDLLNPIQAHYQAVLRPDLSSLFTVRLLIAKQVFALDLLVFPLKWNLVKRSHEVSTRWKIRIAGQ